MKDAKLRRTGIGVLGDVPWGTHLCQLYRTERDLLELLVPFFAAGLEDNEMCLWVLAARLGRETAVEALRQAVPDLDRRLVVGQMEIVRSEDWGIEPALLGTKVGMALPGSSGCMVLLDCETLWDSRLNGDAFGNEPQPENLDGLVRSVAKIVLVLLSFSHRVSESIGRPARHIPTQAS